MIHIYPEDINIINARKIHLNAIKCRVNRKIGKQRCQSTNCKICNAKKHIFKSNKSITKKIITFLANDDNINKIIIGLPNELKEVNDDFFKTVLTTNQLVQLTNYNNLSTIRSKKKILVIHRLFQDIQKIFNYNWLITEKKEHQYSAYHLAENLNRRSCTYCNRTYTTTMVTSSMEKVMRPQFDHWFPRSKFPLLSLSFFNLIPCCNICNSSIKGEKTFDLGINIHPYLDPNQTEQFNFSYLYISSLEDARIIIKPLENNRKVFETLKEFKIDTVYNSHISELQDLIDIKQAYSDSYIEKMRLFFPKSGLSKEETFRILFGTELNVKNYHKRPLSKFKYDILKELGIIDKT